MKKTILLLTLVISSHLWASNQSLDSTIDKHQSEFENVAMTIWDLAEVGYQEYESSKLLQNSLGEPEPYSAIKAVGISATLVFILKPCSFKLF